MVLYITLWYQIRVFTYLCGNFRYWAILGNQHQDQYQKIFYCYAILRWVGGGGNNTRYLDVPEPLKCRSNNGK